MKSLESLSVDWGVPDEFLLLERVDHWFDHTRNEPRINRGESDAIPRESVLEIRCKKTSSGLLSSHTLTRLRTSFDWPSVCRVTCQDEIFRILISACSIRSPFCTRKRKRKSPTFNMHGVRALGKSLKNTSKTFSTRTTPVKIFS